MSKENLEGDTSRVSQQRASRLPYEDHQPDFARLLHSYRVRAGLTQRSFADKLGISLRTYMGWENGERVPPSRERLLLLANELHLTNEEREALFLAAQFSPEPSVNTEQALQYAVDRVAEANPKNIQEVAAAQAEIINSYYLNGLEQSKKSFFWSLIWGG